MIPCCVRDEYESVDREPKAALVNTGKVEEGLFCRMAGCGPAGVVGYAAYERTGEDRTEMERNRSVLKGGKGI